MFETLQERLSGALEKLTGKGALSEGDVATALREVRVALLEADVSLPVARSFIKQVQEKATGGAVLKSVTPGQQVVKVVHDELVSLLGGEQQPLAKSSSGPTVIMVAGLQGSGSSDTCASWASTAPASRDTSSTR